MAATVASTSASEGSRIRKKNPKHVPLKVCWTANMKPLKLLVAAEHKLSSLRSSLLSKGVPENVIEKLVIGDTSVPLFGSGRTAESEKKTMKEIDDLYGDAGSEECLWLRLPATSSVSEGDAATVEQQPPSEVKGKEIEDGQINSVSPSPGKNAIKDVEDLSRQLEEARLSAQAAEQKTQEAESQRLELEMATDRLLFNNSEKDNQIVVLQTRLQELTSMNKLQTHDNEEQDIQIKDLKAHLQELISEHGLLMSGKEKNEAEIKEKDREVADLKANLVKLWAELRSLSDQNDEKLVKIEHLKAQLSNDNEEKDSVIEALETEMKEMSSKNSSLLKNKEMEIAALEATVARTEQECAKLSKELQSCKERSDACNKDAAEKEEHLKILQSQFEKLQTYLTAVEEVKREEAALAKNRMQKAEGEVKGMRAQILELEAQLQKCKEETDMTMKEASSKAAKHQQALEEGHAQALRAVMEQLKEAGCRAQQSERDLEAQRCENAHLVAMLQGAKKHYEALKAELVAAAVAAEAKERADTEDAEEDYVLVTGSSTH